MSHDPRKSGKSGKDTRPAISGVPLEPPHRLSLVAKVDSHYRIPKRGLDPDRLDQHRQWLTFEIQDASEYFRQKAAAAKWGRKKAVEPRPPETVQLYYENDDWFAVPRAYGASRWGMPVGANDERAAGRHVSYFSERFPQVYREQLRENQRQVIDRAYDALYDRNMPCGVIKAPCGYGKTRTVLALASRFGRKILWTAMRTPHLRDAAVECQRLFPDVRIGIVQGPLMEWSEGGERKEKDDDDDEKTEDNGPQIVFATVQTVQRRFPPGHEFWKEFGVWIVDEMHHIPCASYSMLRDRVRAKWWIGVTATPRRKDGLTDALFVTFGPILAEGIKESLPVEVQVLRDPPLTLGTASTLSGPNARDLMRFNTLTMLMRDPCRNRMLIDAALRLSHAPSPPSDSRLVPTRRQIMVLSEYRWHVRFLHDSILRQFTEMWVTPSHWPPAVRSQDDNGEDIPALPPTTLDLASLRTKALTLQDRAVGAQSAETGLPPTLKQLLQRWHEAELADRDDGDGDDGTAPKTTTTRKRKRPTQKKRAPPFRAIALGPLVSDSGKTVWRLEENNRIRLVSTSSGTDSMAWIHGSLSCPADLRELCSIGYFWGGLDDEERNRAMGCSFIMATYANAAENLNIPSIDTLLQASPLGDQEQSVGRITRIVAGKNKPTVFLPLDRCGGFRSAGDSALRWFREQPLTEIVNVTHPFASSSSSSYIGVEETRSRLYRSFVDD